jgi:hypothetical protein
MGRAPAIKPVRLDVASYGDLRVMLAMGSISDEDRREVEREMRFRFEARKLAYEGETDPQAFARLRREFFNGGGA